MGRRTLKTLGLTALVLGWLASSHLATATAQPRNGASGPVAAEGYLIWTRIQEPETGAFSLFAPHHVFVEGLFRCGRVRIEVTRYSTGSYVEGAAADTEQILSKMADRIAGLDKISNAAALLPDVQDVGEQWFWPWNRPKQFGGVEIAEKNWRPQNQFDPRPILAGMVNVLKSISDEEALKNTKESKENFAAALKDPKRGGIFGLATGGGMVRTLQAINVGSRKEAIAHATAMSHASGWAANRYERARPNGRKNTLLEDAKKDRDEFAQLLERREQDGKKPTEEEKKFLGGMDESVKRLAALVEHDRDELTIQVLVFPDKPPAEVNEDLVKKAAEATKEIKTIGLKFQRENDQKNMEDTQKERDEFARQLKTMEEQNLKPSPEDKDRLVKMDKWLDEQKKRLSGKVTFDVDYKWFKENTNFWSWYVSFSRTLRERYARLDQLRAEAGGLGAKLHDLMITNARISQSRQSALNLPKKKQPNQIILDRLSAKFWKNMDEIEQCREELARRSRDAANISWSIVDDVKAAQKRYGQNYGTWLRRWREEYEQVAEKIAFEMAHLGQDNGRFEELLAQSEESKLAPGTRLLVVDHFLKRGETVRALFLLRRFVKDYPQNPDGQKQLATLEASFLETAALKAQGALADARKAFNTYMEARGYKENPFDSEQDGDAYLVLTTGAVSAIYALLTDKPNKELEKMDSSQREMASMYIALRLMAGTRKRGRSLDEITKQVGMPPGPFTPLEEFEPYKKRLAALLGSNEQVAKSLLDKYSMVDVGLAMNRALRLPDVQALLYATTEAELSAAMDKSYFNQDDVAGTLFESLGDAFTSPVGFLGNFVGAAEVQVAGKVVTVTEVAATATRWNKVVEAVGGTAFGERLLKGMQELHGWEAGLWEQGFVKKYYAVQAVKFIGLWITQVETVKWVEEHGGPEATLLVDAILLLNSDTELLVKWLRAGGPQMRQRIDRIMQQVEREVEAAEGRIAWAERRRAKLQELAEQRRAKLQELAKLRKPVEPLPKEHQEVLDKIAKELKAAMPGDVPEAPNGSASHDALTPEKNATKNVPNGTDDGERKALENLQQDVAKEKKAAQTKAEEIRKAREKLAETPEPSSATAKPELKFGANDLVYGPSAQGKLRALQQRAGGILLGDPPLTKPPGMDWEEFTLKVLQEAAESGQQIHFDLTNMKDIPGILKNKGPYRKNTTSIELRFIKKNWDDFKVKPQFYKDGEGCAKPWGE